VVEHGLKMMTAHDIMGTLRMQDEVVISAILIHGVNGEILGELCRKKRLLGIVSKGGSITSAFMLLNQCKNPFIEHFDDVVSICRRHDIVLSLGNTARSGCIHDRHDRMQLAEIQQNEQLAHQAHSAGVQVIIEGAGGHIRSNLISHPW
jgi:phosphomethylpyrimidine synthase